MFKNKNQFFDDQDTGQDYAPSALLDVNAIEDGGSSTPGTSDSVSPSGAAPGKPKLPGTFVNTDRYLAQNDPSSANQRASSVAQGAKDAVNSSTAGIPDSGTVTPYAAPSMDRLRDLAARAARGDADAGRELDALSSPQPLQHFDYQAPTAYGDAMSTLNNPDAQTDADRSYSFYKDEIGKSGVGYNPGMQALDSSLYGASGLRASNQSLATDLSSAQSANSQKAQDYNKSVDSYDADLDTQSADTKNQVTDYLNAGKGDHFVMGKDNDQLHAYQELAKRFGVDPNQFAFDPNSYGKAQTTVFDSGDQRDLFSKPTAITGANIGGKGYTPEELDQAVWGVSPTDGTWISKDPAIEGLREQIHGGINQYGGWNNDDDSAQTAYNQLKKKYFG